ncbi:hypothetical protein DL93DRAFT_2147567 [Clavulina sp. PMI_390]|nr:hypothetical protein DL93DRAFT_2147567 [Clavulina sp. PMI_390]
MASVSPLKPSDPASLPDYEKEEQAPWIIRKLVGSMMGRVVVSSLATLKATGTNVICLSVWGDSSPLILPCIMWRDILLHTVVAATGGTAAIAAPAMSPLMETAASSIGSSIVVEMGLHAGFELSNNVADDLLGDQVDHIIPVYSNRLETTGVKTLLITAPYKHNQLDAALGYFRASVHAGDAKEGLFSSLSDYLSIEKGWWNPVLYASGRRPCIPRSMKPDVIFCHGPFHQSDYAVARQLVHESALVLSFAQPAEPVPPPAAPIDPESTSESVTADVSESTGKDRQTLSSYLRKGQDTAGSYLKVGQEKLHGIGHSQPKSTPLLTGEENKPNSAPSSDPQASPSPDAEPVPTDPPTDPPVIGASPTSPPLRRLAILLVGISPHRKLWATSARPGESVISYGLLNGAPTIVVPAKDGCPLMAWDTLTLKHLHKIEAVEGAKFDGIVDVLMEYVGCCADWERFEFPEIKEKNVNGNGTSGGGKDVGVEERAQSLIKEALAALVAAAIRSKDSKEVKKHIDVDRAGIVMLRLP